MLKNCIKTVAVLCLLSYEASAQELYVDVGLSLVDTKKIDNIGVGPLVRGGWLFNEKVNSFGLEIEANPMSIEAKEASSNEGHNNRDMALTLGTYLVYSFQIPESNFRLRPRVGVVFANLGEDLYKDSSSVAFGLSGLYDITKYLSIYLSYGNFGSSAHQYSSGVSLNF